ncbi:hypothetical protein IQ266_02575 [filamentous cyanobacterium LEGE 11480]|uniref:Carbohydrate kinase PfkB domain-containing protein n=1 Tax=Romeriopsis navalis LEGE 11480 TaxID=2777977 RepID=A0A928VLM2_9CYAN|nr:PfkB family carbohydrate kinase [Romeriopsis navalis]MBE9028642.1 hypothetical protein [Romeriopsis navalis LEGE 11480]
MGNNSTAIFLGRSTIDLTYQLEVFPTEDTKAYSQAFHLQCGGPALNAAITCKLLDGNARLISCFGPSQMAHFARNIVEAQYAVPVEDMMANQDYDFPVSSILVNPANASRTIVNSTPPPKSQTTELTIAPIQNCNLILLDGHNIDSNVQHQIAQAKQQGATIVMDGGSWKPGMEDYLELIDIIICSSRFFWPKCDRQGTITQLHNIGINTVAITNNDRPILLSTNGQTQTIPVPQVDAVDTLGAGDVLHGAFCFYLDRGESIERSLELAAIDASNSCRFLGTHTWQDRANY